jgi:hypothetical protein
MIIDVSGNTPIYINFDLETTGPHPDHSAILSIGAVAVSEAQLPIGVPKTFQQNMKVPRNRFWDKETERWWELHPEALKETYRNALEPRVSMRRFVIWLSLLMQNESPICFVASPSSFDWPIIRSYASEYEPDVWFALLEASGNKDAVRCLDLPTLAMAVRNTPFPQSGRKYWPEAWTPEDLPHTHKALDDATLQSHAFCSMMATLGRIMQ